MAGKKTTKKRAAKKAAPKKAKKVTRERAVSSGGRGSPEAIEKRRVARQLNTLILGGASSGGESLDGRTARKRERILADLKEKQLKPVEVLLRVADLIGMGETFASIKKLGVRPLKTAFAADTDEAREAIAKVQSAYNFPADAWRFIGVTITEEQAEAAE